MLVLPVKEQKHGSFVAGERVLTTTNIHSDKVRQESYGRLLENIASLPKARKKKILAVRYQLDTGNYNIDERLNMATDRLIENLITKRMEENEEKQTT